MKVRFVDKTTSSEKYIAKTLYGLEDLLATELKSLGASGVHPMIRAVEFEGGKRLMYKANLWCRLTTRILKPIARFHAANGDQLYKEMSRIKWCNYLDADSTLAIDSVVSHSGFNHTHYVAQRAKDAIVDQIRNRTGRRPSVDVDNPDLRLNLHIHQNRATLSLDSSGDGLHRRGYRTEGGKAPVNEVLAAGILTLTGWNMSVPLVDIMCGSGTFVIEAAMMARRMAPGLLKKKFGFQNWSDYAPELFETVRKEAEQAALPNLPFGLFGSDKNRHQVADAQSNARRAGVADDVTFADHPFDESDPPPPPGVLVINPPYGERIQVEDIKSLYSSIGDTLKKKFTGYDAFVFTGNLEAAKHVGLRTSRKIKLVNGAIECRLLKYEMYMGTRKAKKLQQMSDEQQ